MPRNYNNKSPKPNAWNGELEARTIDRVRLGEQQPETDHQLHFEKSRTGYRPVRKALPRGR